MGQESWKLIQIKIIWVSSVAYESIWQIINIGFEAE